MTEQTKTEQLAEIAARLANPVTNQAANIAALVSPDKKFHLPDPIERQIESISRGMVDAMNDIAGKSVAAHAKPGKSNGRE